MRRSSLRLCFVYAYWRVYVARVAIACMLHFIAWLDVCWTRRHVLSTQGITEPTTLHTPGSRRREHAASSEPSCRSQPVVVVVTWLASTMRCNQITRPDIYPPCCNTRHRTAKRAVSATLEIPTESSLYTRSTPILLHRLQHFRTTRERELQVNTGRSLIALSRSDHRIFLSADFRYLS